MFKLPIDPGQLTPQFEGFKPGTTLILDGDGPAYVAASKAKTLATAIRNFQQRILELKFLTRCQDAVVHLTPADSYKAGRFLIRAAKPYQGNRKGKAKPPLLEALREAVGQPHNILHDEYSVVMNREVEADDAMMYDSYRLKENGVIWSEDKDLRMTPWPYYDAEYGKVMPSAGFGDTGLAYTKSGNIKPIGQGLKFFWMQMLMGDTADNIQGLKKLDGKLCGPVLAYNSLHDIHDENEAANFVLDGYRAINQNPLPEGWLLWLLRWRGDSFWAYLGELNISAENKDFLADCVRRHWFDTPDTTTAQG